MKRTVLTLAVVMAMLAVVFAVGPRVSVDETLRPVVLPEDLDGYLARSEARFADLRPGVEKTIVWADSSKAKTPVALVYLHGFSATRQETHPLCDTLAARLGANLFYTRLRGHGRSDDAMAEASANDWLNDSYEALAIGRRLGARVVLVGTSTGATLAAWLATQPEGAESLLALVLISPNFGPKDSNARLLLWPWGTTLARLIVGPYRQWEPYNDEQARYWTTRYPSEVLVTMMGLVDLVDHTDLGAIRSSVLVVYSPQDEVIDAGRIEARYPDIGAASKRLVPLETVGDPSNHVLAGAILSPENTEPVAELILEFLALLVE